MSGCECGARYGVERVKKGDLGDTEMVMIFGKQDNHVPAEVCVSVVHDKVGVSGAR